MDSETPRPTGPGHPAAATTTRPAIPVPGPAAPAPQQPGPRTPWAGQRDLPHGPALGVIAQVRAAGSLLLAGVLGTLSGLLGCDALGLGVLTGLLGTFGGFGRRGVLGGSGLLRGGGLVGPGGVLGGALGLLHHSLLRGVLLLDQLDDGHRGVVALAGADLRDAGVAARALRDGRGELLEERVDDGLVEDGESGSAHDD